MQGSTIWFTDEGLCLHVCKRLVYSLLTSHVCKPLLHSFQTQVHIHLYTFKDHRTIAIKTISIYFINTILACTRHIRTLVIAFLPRMHRKSWCLAETRWSPCSLMYKLHTNTVLLSGKKHQASSQIWSSSFQEGGDVSKNLCFLSKFLPFSTHNGLTCRERGAFLCESILVCHAKKSVQTKNSWSCWP